MLGRRHPSSHVVHTLPGLSPLPPFTPALQGCCFKDGETLLVTEYCEGGNLAHNLRARTVGWYRRGKKVKYL